ncbi:MAG: c-type cytochrome [Rubricoccaceae bacterium]|nr:c-type cytochrome [Rubricoccaceae bacterium]
MSTPPTLPDPASPRRDPQKETLPDAVVGDASDRVIRGHKYDGIREYDNPMPGWWTAIFLVSIAFAPLYALGVHAFDWIDDYQDDLAEAQAELAQIREVYASTGPAFKTDPGALAEYAADPAFVEAGAVPYQAVCAACHGEQGQGLIGPNLTDAYWIHGNAPEDVYRVIHEGIPAQGMPAWDGQLSEEEQAQAMAYVLSLVGTDPPGAKEPQGELVP